MKKWMIALVALIAFGSLADVINSTADGVLGEVSTWNNINRPTDPNAHTWNSAGYAHKWTDKMSCYGTYVLQTGTDLRGAGNFDDATFENMELNGGQIHCRRGSVVTVSDLVYVSSDSSLLFSRSGTFKGDGSTSLIGSGNLKIEQDSDSNAGNDKFTFGKDMDLSAYTGTILVTSDGGGATDDYIFQMLGATSVDGTFGLAFENSTTVNVMLDLGVSENFTVNALSFGDDDLANGTYTAADLIAAGYGSWIIGEGRTVTVVPEPATIGMLGLGGLGLMLLRRRFTA